MSSNRSLLLRSEAVSARDIVTAGDRACELLDGGGTQMLGRRRVRLRLTEELTASFHLTPEQNSQRCELRLDVRTWPYDGCLAAVTAKRKTLVF